MSALNVIHHIELWTSDVAASAPSFHWLLTSLGWRGDHDSDWPRGRIWKHGSGTYLVLEQSAALTGKHDRLRAGLNHLALRVGSADQLDQLRQGCGEHGWRELFAHRYPHAGGLQHNALYLENDEGFEFELVAD